MTSGVVGRLVSIAGLALTASACGESGPSMPVPETEVLSVIPAGGAAGVDPSAPITITFSHPMRPGMEMYVALHEGSVAGPPVPGTATWSADRTVLTFTPGAPLKAATTYVLHLGGGMLDANGRPIDYGACPALGGQPVSGPMNGGGMMGPGWRNHGDSSYGMTFEFTTA